MRFNKKVKSLKQLNCLKGSSPKIRAIRLVRVRNYPYYETERIRNIILPTREKMVKFRNST